MTGVRSGIIEFGAIFGQGQRHGFESGGGTKYGVDISVKA